MSQRSKAIIIGAALATVLAVVGGIMAGRRVGDPENAKRFVIGLPPRDAPPPPEVVPPVEEQAMVDLPVKLNPFGGRVNGKLVLSEASKRELRELLAGNNRWKSLRDLAFFLAKGIPLLAVYLLWKGRGETQASITGNSAGATHEPQACSRCNVPDGGGIAQGGEGPDVRAVPPGSA